MSNMAGARDVEAFVFLEAQKLKQFLEKELSLLQDKLGSMERRVQDPSP